MTEKLKMPDELKNQVDFFIKKTEFNEEFEKYRENNSSVDELRTAIAFSINCAYGTAKRTFKGVQKSDEVIKEFKNSVIGYFNSGSFPQTQEEFNTKHEELCKDWTNILRENGNTGDNLSYGKAQKVVNMMFKYMYCCRHLNKISIPEEAFKYCHMTLDSYTLKWISDVWEEEVGKKAKIIKSDTTWSKLDDDKYKEIVKLIEDKIKNPKTSEYDFTGYKKIESEFFIWDYEKFIEALKYMKKIMVSYKDHKDEDLKSLGEASEDLIKTAKEIIKKQTIKIIPNFDDEKDNDSFLK